MPRRASGFVARVADGDNTAHQLRKYLFVFHDVDMKRVGGIVCTHSASAPAPPPLNFTLAPRNADRIVAPERPRDVRAAFRLRQAHHGPGGPAGRLGRVFWPRIVS